MANVLIQYADPKLFLSFRKCLDEVAKEKVFIELIEAPPIEAIRKHQTDQIKRNDPTYFAVKDDEVIGWCDIFRYENPRHNHRGVLGMGVLKKYRKKGLGSSLLVAAIRHATKSGIEKIELNVYSGNQHAIYMYRKHGFVEEGLSRNFRKLDGIYYDCVTMAKFLEPAKPSNDDR